MSTPTAPQPQPAKFDPTATHQQRPKLRSVRGFPAQAEGPDGKTVQVLGLADARQISDRVVFTMPAAQAILPLMDGTRGLDEIVAQVGRGLTRPILEHLVAQLDDAALLEGPVFEAAAAKMRTEFDAAPLLPPASSAAFADAAAAQSLGAGATAEQKTAQGPAKVRELFDQWMAKALENADKPSFDELPAAIVAPHLDYGRGWINYAAVYGRLRVCDRPDRVVILGTNHFGQSKGVCGCDKGYQTPLGVCPLDEDLVGVLRTAVGDGLFAERYDHEREHSVELQVMWVQHIFGTDEMGRYPKVFGALVHDPVVNNGGAYDGKGVGLQPFVGAMKKAVGTLPGRTLVVSSADLSHVGPAFGDQKALAGDEAPQAEARNKVFTHDREMLDLVRLNKPAELVAAMAWQQNPTRWCSTGNLVATLLITEPAQVQMLNYSAAMDQQGMAMVSSVAAAMW